MNKKEYRVIKIIDEYCLVINAGSEDGIVENDTVEIYEIGQEVIDPVTEKSLGTLDTIKAKLTIKTVYPKMCVCENVESALAEQFKGFTSNGILSRKPLSINPADISGDFVSTTNKEIKIGDLARKRG